MKKTNGIQSVDLERLTQSQVAWMIGKPAVWLRDNPHLIERNVDGTYDASKVVQGLRREFEAAELADGDFEPIIQFTEAINLVELEGKAAIIRIWRGIEKQYGAAGLAGIASVILSEIEAAHRRYGEFELESIQSIKDACAVAIAEATQRNNRRKGECVVVCDYCGKFRRGRRWIAGTLPAKAGIWKSTCPTCDAE